MHREFSTFIEGPVAAQPRPKVGKFSVYYSGKKYKIWKELVDLHLCSDRPEMPLEGPLIFKARFYIERPKSHYRTPKKGIQRASGWSLHHTGKPDLDNLIKLVLDSCNTVLFADDSQVTHLSIEKHWVENAIHPEADTPGVWIYCREMDPPKGQDK